MFILNLAFTTQTRIAPQKKKEIERERAESESWSIHYPYLFNCRHVNRAIHFDPAFFLSRSIDTLETRTINFTCRRASGNDNTSCVSISIGKSTTTCQEQNRRENCRANFVFDFIRCVHLAHSIWYKFVSPTSDLADSYRLSDYWHTHTHCVMCLRSPLTNAPSTPPRWLCLPSRICRTNFNIDDKWSLFDYMSGASAILRRSVSNLDDVPMQCSRTQHQPTPCSGHKTQAYVFTQLENMFFVQTKTFQRRSVASTRSQRRRPQFSGKLYFILMDLMRPHRRFHSVHHTLCDWFNSSDVWTAILEGLYLK